MIVKRLFAVLMIALMLHGTATAVVYAQEQQATAPAAQEQAESDEKVAIGGDKISLVELELKGRTITGRLISETEEVMKVKVLGAGEIGYSKKLINNVKRRSVTRDVYYEMVGDYYANRTWDFKNDLEDFIQARKNYARALLYARSEERKMELREKYENIKKEREEWHRENVKQEELRKAEKEAQTAELEKELTRKQLENLESMRAYRQRIFQLEDAVGQLSREVQRLRSLVFELEDELSDLESVYYRYGRGYYYSYPAYPRYRRNHRNNRDDDDRDQRRGPGRRRPSDDDNSSGDQQGPPEQSPEEEEDESDSPFGWQPKPW